MCVCVRERARACVRMRVCVRVRVRVCVRVRVRARARARARACAGAWSICSFRNLNNFDSLKQSTAFQTSLINQTDPTFSAVQQGRSCFSIFAPLHARTMCVCVGVCVCVCV